LKILIVAGPYEADRIRRAAVSVGVEAVAVEPGESLSGWITATRPELIVLAPRVISPQPAVALAKIRAVPRGRVPILMVGDADEEPALRPLAEGFFVRPVAPDDLLQQARAAVAMWILRGPPEAARPAPRVPGGGQRATLSGASPWLPRSPAVRPPLPAQETTPMVPPSPRDLQLGAEARSRAAASDAKVTASRGAGWLDRLGEDIDAQMDADLDAEARDVVRVVDGIRNSGTVGASGTAQPAKAATSSTSAGSAAPDRTHDDGLEVTQALSELTDENGREIPQGSADDADETELDPPALFGRMYLSRLSGRLTLRHGKIKKHVVFERGHPVLAGSNQIEDRLGEMLVRQGRLTAAQAGSLGDEAAATGRRLGVVLVDRGFIAASELTGIVRRHYEEIVYSLFSWNKGAWNLGTDTTTAVEKVLLSLHPAALIVEGIRRVYGDARAIRSLGGAEEVYQLRPGAGLSEVLEKMGLEAAERRAVLLFDGLGSLAAIAGASGLSPERLHALAWTLFVLDRLEPAPIARQSGSPAANGGRAPTSHGRSANAKERDEAIDRALVLARAALVADGDYFQILGIPRDADTDEIRRAHQVLSAGLVPGSLHPAVAADLENEIHDIRLVLDEATRLLSDADLRQAYREHLPGHPAFADDAEDAARAS
jgi:Domain of unknown function (DUF4388)